MTEESLTLTFDPFLLPTAQHRAGLAGLMVLVESMTSRGLKPVPLIRGPADGRYQVEWTHGSLQSVFNELYDAGWEERERNSKKTKGKAADKQVVEPKRSEVRLDRHGKEKTVYLYDELVPRAAFLSALQIPDCWLNLWRDAVWSTLRAIPRTRIPYEERSEGQNTGEASKTWAELSRFRKDLAGGAYRTQEVASSVFVGAQANNAEMVPFRGRVDENLLLNFWPVVMGVFLPVANARDGKQKYEGYVLTVPDVIDFERFQNAFRETVAQLDRQTVGSRPRDSLIVLPQEGALEYMHHLTALAKARQEAQSIAYSVTGIEVFCLSRKGHSVHVSSSDRVPISEDLLEEYDAIRNRYWHTLFRKQMILNLLAARPWYSGFDRVFDINPYENFLGKKTTFFQSDAARRFRLDNEEWREAHE